MMDDKTKQLHDLEQASAAMAEYLPPLLWRLFCRLQSEGFDKEQAFKLVTVMAFGQVGGKMVQ
jgi:hypothetical protein